MSDVAVTDQLFPLLVPQPERKRFQAGDHGDGLHFTEHRVRPMTPLKIVVWNPRAQMMDVMKPDVP
jgi:hypothetical protein